jgi:hypothetical protein
MAVVGFLRIFCDGVSATDDMNEPQWAEFFLVSCQSFSYGIISCRLWNQEGSWPSSQEPVISAPWHRFFLDSFQYYLPCLDKIANVENYNLCSSSTTTSMMTLNVIRWVGPLACMGKVRLKIWYKNRNERGCREVRVVDGSIIWKRIVFSTKPLFCGTRWLLCICVFLVIFFLHVNPAKHILLLCISPTQHVCVFLMIVTINSD